MNKEFIPYEQALALKELGFDEQCFGYYYTLNGKDWKFADDKQYDSLDEFYNIGSMFTISAPLYQQTFKWFREHCKNIVFNVADNRNQLFVQQAYNYLIDTIDNRYQSEVIFKTYEEAQLECLRKLIEIVKIK